MVKKSTSILGPLTWWCHNCTSAKILNPKRLPCLHAWSRLSIKKCHRISSRRLLVRNLNRFDYFKEKTSILFSLLIEVLAWESKIESTPRRRRSAFLSNLSQRIASFQSSVLVAVSKRWPTKLRRSKYWSTTIRPKEKLWQRSRSSRMTLAPQILSSLWRMPRIWSPIKRNVYSSWQMVTSKMQTKLSIRHPNTTRLCVSLLSVWVTIAART